MVDKLIIWQLSERFVKPYEENMTWQEALIKSKSKSAYRKSQRHIYLRMSDGSVCEFRIGSRGGPILETCRECLNQNNYEGYRD